MPNRHYRCGDKSNQHNSDDNCPCSYYLSAQSASVLQDSTSNGESYSEFRSLFGRSPQCTSMAHIGLSYSNCNNVSSTLLAPEAYVPQTLLDLEHGVESSWCCGHCMLFSDSIRLFYFPPSYNNCSQASGVTMAPASASSNSSGIHKRVHSLAGDGSGIAV